MKHKEEFKYNLHFVNSEDNNVYESMETICSNWTKKELLNAIEDGFLEYVEMATLVTVAGDTDVDDLNPISWSHFFLHFDEVESKQTYRKIGIIPELVFKFAEVAINYDNLIIIHENGMKAPEKKEKYTYNEILDIYEQGMYFVDLGKGKLTPQQLIDIENPIWSMITPEDASKISSIPVEEINTNANAGYYGLHRSIGSTVLFGLKSFADYHRLV